MLGTPIWPNMRVPGPRLKNPSAIPGYLLKKFLVSPHFRDQANAVNDKSASKKDFVKAGEKALVCLYNGKSDEGLDSLSFTFKSNSGGGNGVGRSVMVLFSL